MGVGTHGGVDPLQQEHEPGTRRGALVAHAVDDPLAGVLHRYGRAAAGRRAGRVASRPEGQKPSLSALSSSRRRRRSRPASASSHRGAATGACAARRARAPSRRGIPARRRGSGRPGPRARGRPRRRPRCHRRHGRTGRTTCRSRPAPAPAKFSNRAAGRRQSPSLRRSCDVPWRATLPSARHRSHRPSCRRTPRAVYTTHDARYVTGVPDATFNLAATDGSRSSARPAGAT